MKKTKLTETPTRIPDTRHSFWEEIIPKYVREVESIRSESGRSHRFAALLQQLLGLEPGFIESYSAGIEKYLKVRQKDRILRGEADNLFGNIVIEFETKIPQKQQESEEQLCRYVAILWSQEPVDKRTPYLCIATDGVRFVSYSPTLPSTEIEEVAPDDVILQVLEKANWSEVKPYEVFYWLDRYFLRKEILHPTSETIVHDFGVKSHAFQTSMSALLTLWQQLKPLSEFTVVYDSWEKYLRIVYGSDVAGDTLFVRHTYLATLAKLMSWIRISESKRMPTDEQIIEMLEGRFFKNQGIENFIEEDFFSWLARPKATRLGISTVRWLYSLLQNYNLRELSEDVLKSLYQELVDPETRHDLGEFYTPDWLAHRIIRKLLDEKVNGAMLDPTCGSGTFLYLAIREKSERLGKSTTTLQHILDSVCGADIHPLAVIVARTNFILALGDLLKKRKGTITIPVYLADTLKLPERWARTEHADYEVMVNDRAIYIPELLLKDLAVYDQAIEFAKDFARQNKGKRISRELFNNFLKAQGNLDVTNTALVDAIFNVADTLKYLIDSGRDTIWAFILKNIYKPLFFKQKFDFIVGNPPWIVFRYMEPGYQAFLKRQITKVYKLLSGRAELITHLEIATLFLVHSADLYLKTNGTIAFVLPKSLFSADQHNGLRKSGLILNENKTQNLVWREVWDCEDVMPLFNVPACVLLADKNTSKKTTYPLSGQILHGKLTRKNTSFIEAERLLNIKDVHFSLHIRGKRSFWSSGKAGLATESSFYKKRFAQGATIVPRSFWFVQIKPFPLGINPRLPLFETADRAKEMAKNAYKDITFRGNVECRFLFATLLSTDLLPFGHLDHRMVVLPIVPEDDHFKLLDKEQARQQGFLYLEQWLEKAEMEWKKRRGVKAERITILEWLDYRRKLTLQNPKAKYRVIYNTSGTFLTAAMVENGAIFFEIGEQVVEAQGFVANDKIYYYETSNYQEAFYLVTVLNAPVIDRLIKPMQSRGLWGPRDIHKKVLELPIPQFDANNPVHKQLVEIGEESSIKVKKWLASGGAGQVKSIGTLRGRVREMLKSELNEINELVQNILK